MTLLPGSTIGMLGGGQLGRMFTVAARTLGYRVIVLEPDPHSPAGQLADEHPVSTGTVRFMGRRWSAVLLIAANL